MGGGKKVGVMIDQLLDWEDELPEKDYDMADEHADLCARPGGLAICLGTSMQMTPARDWPCKADKLVIVNLQPTIKDHAADLVIRAPIDRVMALVMAELGEDIPPFRRSEKFVVCHELHGNQIEGGDATAAAAATWTLHIVDECGAPCGFILEVLLSRRSDRTVGGDGVGGPESSTRQESSRDLLLHRQPFAYDGNGTGVFQLTVVFDKVPVGRGMFHQPPNMVINYTISGNREDCSRTFAVDLSAPACSEVGDFKSTNTAAAAAARH